jgi:hypothetical protein
MKKSIFRYAVLLAWALIFSCKEEDEIRFPEFQDGPNVRIQIDPNKSFFDFQDRENTYLGYGLYSENKDLDKVEILVQYLPVGGTPSAQLVAKTYTQADIDANNGALPTEKISLVDMATLFGKAVLDFQGGDQFKFNNRTTMANGTVYPSATVGGNLNVTSDLSASAATTSYTDNFSAIVGCPVTAAFTGDYNLKVITAGVNTLAPPAPRYKEAKVTISAVNPITRSFTIGYLGFDRPFTFILLCGNVTVNLSSGLSCSGNALVWTTPTPATYDPNDDNTFDIVMLDNTNKACGETAAPINTVLRFTKL